MKTALITGANKSIGFETARQLLQQGYYVYLGSRDIQKGQQAVSQLRSEGLRQVEPIEIDVNNIDSIKAARETLGHKTSVLAYNLRETPFKVNAVDPGYTATDFNHHSGPGAVPDAAARVVKAAMLDKNGPTGQSFSDDNEPDTGISPW